MSGIELGSLIIFILGASQLIKQRQMKQRGEQEATKPAWQEKHLTKEQQRLVSEQYTAFRKEVYKDYPQVGKFDLFKRRWKYFIMLYYLSVSILRLYVLSSGADGSGVAVSPVLAIIGSVIGCLIGIFFLAIAMGTKWQTAGILYLIGFFQAKSFVEIYLETGMDSFGEFIKMYIENFRYYPAMISADILSMIYTLLLLLTAIWLTLVPRNRKLAEQAEMLLSKFTPIGI